MGELRKPLTTKQVLIRNYSFAWPTARDVVFHEWTHPGRSRCGLRWTLGGMRISDKEHRVVAVHAALAKSIGVPCRKCYPQ